MEKEIKQCDGKWKGYYIKASQEAYDLLVADGYKPYSEHTKNADFFSIGSEFNKTATYFQGGICPKFKHLYIVDSKLSVTKKIEQICDNPDVNSLTTKIKNIEKEELKEKYNTGKYDCYARSGISVDWYLSEEYPLYEHLGIEYKLILKEHSHIADAVIANPDVEVEYKTQIGWFNLVANFFETYSEESIYELKEQPKQVSEDAFTIAEGANVNPNEQFVTDEEAAVINKFKNTGGNTQSFVDVKKKVLECTEFEDKVYNVLNEINLMLVDKNKKYGNSALEPKRIFSKADSAEQLKVRIDDKLSRISNQNINEDEDVIMDLLGYLVLLKVVIDDSK